MDAKVDFDNPNSSTSDFDVDVKVRHQFIAKVFGLLTLCLILTCGIVSILRFEPHSYNFLKDTPVLLAISTPISIVLVIIFVCFPNIARKFPWNYILLLVMVLSYSLTIAFCTIYSRADAILLAAFFALAMTILLMLFACQTKFDFTSWGPYLLVAALGLLCLVIFTSFFTKIIGYLIYHTQLIIGGRKHELDPSEFAFATFILYVDIIDLFIIMLELLEETVKLKTKLSCNFIHFYFTNISPCVINKCIYFD
ncbi:Protein lifeguard 3 [Thelohanellus kitauei]|uniref:Protein lifeguard 3 n=1 Tax=Thelohanellus kitauei TaxID=669202 RepID=A0A0C2N307_THEKT|nr:Protein lifeguard 3 [Thelohanellus kitauei]